jgi:hypothetical protein
VVRQKNGGGKGKGGRGRYGATEDVTARRLDLVLGADLVVAQAAELRHPEQLAQQRRVALLASRLARFCHRFTGVNCRVQYPVCACAVGKECNELGAAA